MSDFHFAIRVQGKLNSVLRVKEKTNGGLIIIPTLHPDIWLSGQKHEGKNGHFTIHPNLKSETGSTNLHTHVDGENGKLFDKTTHILGPKENLLFPIISGNVANFSNHQSQLNNEDQYVEIDEYDPKVYSLSIFVFITDCSIELGDVGFPCFSYSEKKFSKFRLGIFSILRLCPSFSGSYGVMVSTRVEEKDTNPDVGKNGFSPLGLGEAFLQMVHNFGQLSEQLLMSLPSELSKETRDLIHKNAGNAWVPARGDSRETIIPNFGDVRSVPPALIAQFHNMPIPRSGVVQADDK